LTNDQLFELGKKFTYKFKVFDLVLKFLHMILAHILPNLSNSLQEFSIIIIAHCSCSFRLSLSQSLVGKSGWALVGYH